MKYKAKAATCPCCGGRHSKSYLCEGEFEGWEIDYELLEKKDYAGLVAHYQAVVEWQPGHPHWLHKLGEAYLLNGEPEKAIELLSEPHRQNPYHEDLQHVILGALFALGKDETEFDWVERLPVYRLDASFLERCHAYLKPKREPLDAEGLRLELGIHGYCAFTSQDLLDAIRRDPRFVVEEDEFGCLEIRARRKRDGRAKPRLIEKKNPEVGTTRRSRLVARAEAAGLPTIPEPEPGDPELGRTRLYPLWGNQTLYGEPQSREEEEREAIESLNAQLYREKGDLEGGIAHYLDILSRRPSDIGVLYALGRTLLENDEPDKVLEVIGAAHHRYPRLLDFQEVLLDALFALDRDELDFEWSGEIRIYRLDSRVSEWCFEYLKRKRKPRYGSELMDLISRRSIPK